MDFGVQYKEYGFLRQRGSNTYGLRLRTVAGELSADKMRKIADLAEEYSSGTVHITTRQGIEISGINVSDIPKVREAVKKHDLKIGGLGKRVRAITSCQGRDRCRHGMMDCRPVAEKLDEAYFGREIGIKTKIAICGCANACSRPRENDIGIIGVIEPIHDDEACLGCGICEEACPGKAIELYEEIAVRDSSLCIGCGTCIEECPNDAWHQNMKGYHVYAGGNAGKHSRRGTRIEDYVYEEDVVSKVGEILEIAQELVIPGERIGDIIERLGAEVFKKD